MRIAILTDIHANREAFEAALQAAAERGATQHVILGDIVGYGADPVWCVEQALALADQGATVVRGNHDQAIGDASIPLNSAARAAVEWTRGQLRQEHRTFLHDLPLLARDGDRLYVHADASAPGRYHYVTDSEGAAAHFASSGERLSFCGHVHRPQLYALGPNGKVTAFKPTGATPVPLLQQRRWLAVIGAAGQPRDGDPAAGFAILDTDTGELTFLKVPYDIEAAAAKIRAAGLPDELATRLFRGK